MKEKNNIKLSGVIIGLVMAIGQHGFYLMGHLIGKWIGIPPFSPKIPAVDDLFKVTPVFIIPYVWSYAHWFINHIVVSKCEKLHFKKYVVANVTACAVGMLALALFPTYMDRVAEGLMDTSAHTGFCADLMRFWYSLDGGEIAYNLLPSFHCLNTTVGFLGVYGRKEIPRWYRIYSVIVTVAIYFSVLFVKQHYIVDIFGGIAIAAVCWMACSRIEK